jgi:serine/threonine protein kinase
VLCACCIVANEPLLTLYFVSALRLSLSAQAPEVMTQPSYDAKADIWSLGVTCYEMAFGHPPNATVHPLKVTMLIPRLPAPEVGTKFSTDFQAFVKACCVKNPAQRADISTLLKMPFVAKGQQGQGKALTWD